MLSRTVLSSPGAVTATFSAVSGSPIATAACVMSPLLVSSSSNLRSGSSIAFSTAARSGSAFAPLRAASYCRCHASYFNRSSKIAPGLFGGGMFCPLAQSGCSLRSASAVACAAWACFISLGQGQPVVVVTVNCRMLSRLPIEWSR